MTNGPEEVVASAPGKVIITGEHFVVHGSYAVAAAISKRVTVKVEQTEHDSVIVSQNLVSKVSANDQKFLSTKAVIRTIIKKYSVQNEQFRINIDSDIPPGSGLGSSAAVSVATAAALTKFLQLDVDTTETAELALVGEKQVHGNPSGIDIQASLQGGLLLFNKSSGTKAVPLDRAIQFLIIFSGKSRRTGELISKVAARKRKFPATFENLAHASSFLSLEVVDAATSGDLQYLGAVMNIAQSSLSWIGVSTGALDRLVEYVLSNEAFGAKITGAGGGGSVIALPRPEKADSSLRSALKKYPYSFLTSIPQEGLRWETK